MFLRYYVFNRNPKKPTAPLFDKILLTSTYHRRICGVFGNTNVGYRYPIEIETRVLTLPDGVQTEWPANSKTVRQKLYNTHQKAYETYTMILQCDLYNV